ncbi:MAG: EF-hand domain-containing protein [Bosea sp.]|nr:EF-hand domain-containing protein [Bosea sp. (in: a-proteobacteria)]
MKTLLLATTLALAPVLALPAAAATDPAPATTASPRAQMMFWYLDRNGDGVIDAAEITAWRTARFASLDTNGDGKLTRDEAIAGMKGAGKGGKHRQGDKAMEARGDGKGDGKGDAAKAERRAERREKRQERALERLGFTDGVTEITVVEFLKQPMPMIGRADADKNGSITKEEFFAAAGRRGASVPN